MCALNERKGKVSWFLNVISSSRPSKFTMVSSHDKHIPLIPFIKRSKELAKLSQYFALISQEERLKKNWRNVIILIYPAQFFLLEEVIIIDYQFVSVWRRKAGLWLIKGCISIRANKWVGCCCETIIFIVLVNSLSQLWTCWKEEGAEMSSDVKSWLKLCWEMMREILPIPAA